jgi:hypothetical protein
MDLRRQAAPVWIGSAYFDLSLQFWNASLNSGEIFMMVIQSGIEPASTAYRADALPLSYKTVIASRYRRTQNPPERGAGGED